MDKQNERARELDRRVGVIDRADLQAEPPRNLAATGAARAEADQDYMKRGTDGRRGFGFLVVLAVHWVIIVGLLFGTGILRVDTNPRPMQVAPVDPSPQPEPDPLPTPPEIPIEDDTVIWVPAPDPIPYSTPPGEGEPPSGSPDAAPPGPDVPVRIDARFPPSKPDYPAAEKRLGHEGVVTLLLLVGPDGRVVEAKVERSSGYPALDKAALEEARAWRFRPAEKGGRAVSAWYRTSVRFQLNEG